MHTRNETVRQWLAAPGSGKPAGCAARGNGRLAVGRTVMVWLQPPSSASLEWAFPSGGVAKRGGAGGVSAEWQSRRRAAVVSHRRDCHSASPPLPPLVVFSIGMDMECQQDVRTLADGCGRRSPSTPGRARRRRSPSRRTRSRTGRCPSGRRARAGVVALCWKEPGPSSAGSR